MYIADSVVTLAVAGGCVLATAVMCFAVLARVGAGWRETTDEWWPDEIGGPDE